MKITKVGAVWNRTGPQQTPLAKRQPRLHKKLDKQDKICYNRTINAKGKYMTAENSKPSFVQAGMSIIDCDLHNRLPSHRMLYPYLPDYWCDYCEESGFPGPDANDYPDGVPTSSRPEISHPSEDRPVSDLALLRTHALDFWEAEYGILTCGFRVQSVHNEDLAAALASAVNDWQIEHWLDAEPRLRGSLIVPSQNPELAVKEIERLGGHPGFVQVMLPARSQAPYGNRRYHPIYAAAVRHQLVIGIHYGGAPGLPPTSVGWPLNLLGRICRHVAGISSTSAESRL